MDNSLDPVCSICLQIYTDRSAPRNLTCGHCVCTTCLAEILTSQGGNKECPECRKKIKSKTVEELVINQPMLRISRMHAFSHLVKTDTPTTELIIKTPDNSPFDSAGKCSVHGHDLFFSCQRCDKVVCRDCIVSEHLDPPYGKCVIITIQEKSKRVKKLYLEHLIKCIDRIKTLVKEADYLIKYSKIAVTYWEKQDRHKRGEDYEIHLEESQRFYEKCQEKNRLFQGNQFLTIFTEVKTKLEEAQNMTEILGIIDDNSLEMANFENYKASDLNKELACILDRFWNGGKPKFIK